jgi:putative ABC transport system permease protein
LLQAADSTQRAVVLSENAWRARFGAAADVVGSTVTVNGQPYTVIGVAQKEFAGITAGSRADAWLPIESADAITGGRGGRDDRGVYVFARLQPGITVEAAQASMRAAAAAVPILPGSVAR